MSNSVLCAVDTNDLEHDKAVLVQAARLAALDDAQLDVLTVVPDYGMSIVGSFFDKSQHDRVLDEARKRLGEMTQATLGDERDSKVRHLVSTGKAYEEILKTAEATDCSLIVIGAHTPDLADYLLGPNAARVVRHSKCSVFVVR